VNLNSDAFKLQRERASEWTVLYHMEPVHWGTWHSCRAYIRRKYRESLGI
jgi:hypothetical protein